ncbi:MAG: hypothetical protein U5K54_11950 [Cytophagales bacterium]|nr:hypothetical protein [Cytophagales bacterium]
MRFIYILAGILVWCLGASFWYLFWVKGLSPQTENINPHESALAIAEILIMILVSVFIGFALFWVLNQQTVSKKVGHEAVQQLLSERATFTSLCTITSGTISKI